MARAMNAVQIRAFGGLDAMTYTKVGVPRPGAGQVLVRVFAAGVGPWDMWVREGRSAVPQPLPLVPGADFSGIVETVGDGVTGIACDEEIYGVTNARFVGAYAEMAAADAAMIARKPIRLGHVQAASVPVAASTAWQMLFDVAHVERSHRVLVHGGAGNVGGYAVQIAHWVGADVTATASERHSAAVRALGANTVVDDRAALLKHANGGFNSVIDTVGGTRLAESFALLRPGGILVSAVEKPDKNAAARYGVRAEFILVSVTTRLLQRLGTLIDAGTLSVRVGEILPLSEARIAHEMLAGRTHRPGKIVLIPGA
jgi:NADPH:quinone reductase-like Zn-dependent oxidoreductase